MVAGAGSGRSRRLAKDYEYRVQTSRAMIDIAAVRLMLNRLAPPDFSHTLSARLLSGMLLRGAR